MGHGAWGMHAVVVINVLTLCTWLQGLDLNLLENLIFRGASAGVSYLHRYIGTYVHTYICTVDQPMNTHPANVHLADGSDGVFIIHTSLPTRFYRINLLNCIESKLPS